MIYQPGDGVTRTRNYYACTRRVNWHDCDARMSNTAIVDDQMLQVVHALAIPDDWQKEVIAQAEQLLKATPGSAEPSQEAIVAEIERWGEVYARGAISKTKFDRTVAELEAKLSNAPATPRQPNLIQAAALLAEFPKLMEAASLVERRTIMRHLFSKVWLQRHEVVAITPTALYMPLVVAAQTRYSGGSNNQGGGTGGSEQGRTDGGEPAASGQRGDRGKLGSHPAHQHALFNHCSGFAAAAPSSAAPTMVGRIPTTSRRRVYTSVINSRNTGRISAAVAALKSLGKSLSKAWTCAGSGPALGAGAGALRSACRSRS
jgi:hypothetical protein